MCLVYSCVLIVCKNWKVVSESILLCNIIMVTFEVFVVEFARRTVHAHSARVLLNFVLD